MREKQEKEKKKKKEKEKKGKQIFSLIEKNHKNIWKWKLRSNEGVVGKFKRKQKRKNWKKNFFLI